MSGVLILQILLAGSHCGICLQQVLYAFLVAPIPEAYITDQGQPTHVAQHGLYLVNVSKICVCYEDTRHNPAC
jgi:hypothetical protein